MKTKGKDRTLIIAQRGNTGEQSKYYHRFLTRNNAKRRWGSRWEEESSIRRTTRRIRTRRQKSYTNWNKIVSNSMHH